MSTQDPAEQARQSVDICWGDPSRCHPQRLAEAGEEARLRAAVPWHAEAYVRTLRGLVGSFVRAYLPGDGSLWRAARAVTVPTLVVSGHRDRLVDVLVAPQVARAVPDSRLLILDGVGHLAQVESPVLVARAVLGMLDEVASGTRVRGA